MKLVGFHVIKKIEWGFPFYSPLYRDLFDMRKINSLAGGNAHPVKRMIGFFIYLLFFLNSYI
jgi:hypothetical protein